MRTFDVKRCFCVTLVLYCLGGLWVCQVVAGEKVKEGTAGFTKGTAGQEQATSEEKPRISFDAMTYDAGEVWEGDVVSHDFIVKNTGTAELAIKGVKPG